jgi:FtsH-binding integral membrane protein
MAYDPSNSPSQSYSGSRVVDAGLQSYMQSVYKTMGLGLVISGLTAFGVASTPALFNLLFHGPLVYVVILAPLLFVWLGFKPQTMSSEKLKLMFVIFSAVMGLSLSVLFLVYTGASIIRVFFITAATFAATSLYGYTTKRDLTGVGSFMFMGLVGIVIAGVVNLFMQSAMMNFVVSAIGVIVFTGLAAWNTQYLKTVYQEGATESNARMAIMGALNLYLDFINLFRTLLYFMGDRK